MESLLSAKEIQTAKSAGLVYVSDKMPGFRRIGTKKVFRYLDTRGHVIRNPEVLRRMQRLAIPPAWREVWICPNPDGHLQAVGRDARRRKQYRYHPQWREARDETKYSHMVAFGKALPRIRRRIARDLKGKQLTPAILNGYAERAFPGEAHGRGVRGLAAEECAVLDFLQHR